MSKATSPTPASMIDRVVDILGAFEGVGSLTLAQVVSRTGLPRSSAHRILEHLVKVRWLRREDNTYELGLRMLELGTLAAHHNALRSAALPHLHNVQNQTSLVVHLAVLDGTDIVYLDKVGGRLGMRVPSRVGGRAPAHCTAAGKMLLASAGDAVLRGVLDGPMAAPTSASLVSERRLRTELGRVVDRGVAFDREESAYGIGCVAAPVGQPDAPSAAISLCGPISRVNFEQLVGPVRAAAHQISTSLRTGRIPFLPSSLSDTRMPMAAGH
jgi:DNA-binding IclR family transcriptional regulator